MDMAERGEGKEDVQHIGRSNNEAPARPDRTGSHKSHVLCEGELLSGS